MTYTLEEISAQSAMAMLRLAVPQAQLSIGARTVSVDCMGSAGRPGAGRADAEANRHRRPRREDPPRSWYMTSKSDDVRQTGRLRHPGFSESAVPEARFDVWFVGEGDHCLGTARRTTRRSRSLIDEFAEKPERRHLVLLIYNLREYDCGKCHPIADETGTAWPRFSMLERTLASSLVAMATRRRPREDR